MTSWKDLKDPEFWKDKKKYFKAINNILIKYFKWFVILSVVIVLVVGFFLLLKPKYDQINSLLESSQQKQQELIRQRVEKLENLQGIIESYDNIPEHQKDKIKAILPERKTKEELFTEIKQLVEANNNKLVLKSISIHKGGEKEEDKREVTTREEAKDKKDDEQEIPKIDRSVPEGVEKLKLEILVFGTNYNNIKRLLTTLENSLPIIDVTQISFSSGGNSVNLTLETYQLK